jgi:hypothetical protein
VSRHRDIRDIYLAKSAKQSAKQSLCGRVDNAWAKVDKTTPMRSRPQSHPQVMYNVQSLWKNLWPFTRGATPFFTEKPCREFFGRTVTGIRKLLRETATQVGGRDGRGGEAC